MLRKNDGTLTPHDLLTFRTGMRGGFPGTYALHLRN